MLVYNKADIIIISLNVPCFPHDISHLALRNNNSSTQTSVRDCNGHIKLLQCLYPKAKVLYPWEGSFVKKNGPVPQWCTTPDNWKTKYKIPSIQEKKTSLKICKSSWSWICQILRDINIRVTLFIRGYIWGQGYPVSQRWHQVIVITINHTNSYR